MFFTDDGIGREVTSGDNSLTECVDILFFGRHDLFDGRGEGEVTPHEGDSRELCGEFLEVLRVHGECVVTKVAVVFLVCDVDFDDSGPEGDSSTYGIKRGDMVRIADGYGLEMLSHGGNGLELGFVFWYGVCRDAVEECDFF